MELLLSLAGWFLTAWFAAGVIAVLSTIGLAFRHLRPTKNTASSKSKLSRSTVQHQEKLRSAVLQVVPIHPHNGWRLEGMWHGLRVFSRSFPSLPMLESSGPHHLPALAASVIVSYPTKRALSLVTGTRELACWMEGISPKGVQVLSKDNDGDILSLTSYNGHQGLLDQARKRIVKFFEKYVPFLDGLVAPPTEVTTETVERSWHCDDSFSFVFLIPKQPSQLPYSWSFLMLNSLRESGISLATLVMMPTQHKSNKVRSLVAKQLCSLREHVTLKSLGVYSTSREATPTKLPLPPKGKTNKSHDRAGLDNKSHQRKPRSQRHVSEPTLLEPIGEVHQTKPPLHRSASASSEPSLTALRPDVDHMTTVGGASSPTALLDAKYFDVAEASAQKLVAAADGGEREGWVMVGTTKDVTVMKKPAARDEPPINSVKGVGIVKVPPRFIIRVLNNPSYTTVLDDMLKESRVVLELSKSLHLVHLLYKAVWPTAPREFSVLSILGELDERTWISSGISVDDPRISPEKGYVRAQLDVGGYLIRSVPSDPEISKVTYVARVDLKGNIPAFAVNKISESQPLCVNRLRGLVEPLYTKMKADPQKMREFEEKYPIAMVIPPKAPSSSSSTAELTNHVTRPPAPEGAGGERSDVAMETSATPTGSLATEGGVGGARATNARNEATPSPTLVVRRRTNAAVPGGGKMADVRNDSSTRLPAADHSEREVKGEKEEDEEEEEGSSVVISMSDLNPADALRIPPNSKLLPSPPRSPDGGNSLFSIGEGDGESTGESLNDEFLQTYTPEQLPSDPEDGEESELLGGKGKGSSNAVFVTKPSPALQLKLPNYQRVRESIASSSDNDLVETHSLTKDTINYPMLVEGGVDFKTMANQTAAKALEEAFHVSSINPLDPSTFTDQGNGWRFAGYEKDVVILSKKTDDSPYTCFMGKGVIDLPPQSVFDSIRNPQLRFTYDNMLKELHIVKHVDEGLYILHLHHQTTQCFMKTSRDFCILVSERSEPNKMLLVGTSIDVPECPPTPNVHRGRIFCSGWIIEPYQGNSSTQITYMLQVDVGGLPSSLVNFVSKRQPLAVAYVRDYLVSTSLELSTKESSSTSSS